MSANKLPKFGARTLIRFWSLRPELGAGGGVIFDCDKKVEHICRRVMCRGDWKWQIVGLRSKMDIDYYAECDQDILDSIGSDADVEIVMVL